VIVDRRDRAKMMLREGREIHSNRTLSSAAFVERPAHAIA
jgi:hypothetical protein